MVAWGVSAPALLCLLLATSGLAAETVGVAAAVNPDAFSSLGGSPQSELKIGKSIFYNERINTTGSGIVQVLLVDGSTFSIGPGSDLVIDKFVYDSKKGTGQITASFSKGVMRFVGGRISKNEDAVSIKTTAGALAVRGGMFYGLVEGRRGLFPFLFGVELKLTLSNGRVLRAFEQRYTIDTEKGVRPTTREDIDIFMRAFGAKSQGVAGKGQEGSSSPKDANTNGLIQDANATRIQEQLDNQLARSSGPFGPDGNSGGNTDGGNTVGGTPGASGDPGGTLGDPPPIASLQAAGWGVDGTPPCPNCIPLADGGGPPGLAGKETPGLGGGLPPGLGGDLPPGLSGNPPDPPSSLPPTNPPATLPVGLGVGGTPPPMTDNLASVPTPFVDGLPGNAAASPPATLPPAALDLPATLPPLPDVAKANPPGPPDNIIPGAGNGKGNGKP